MYKDRNTLSILILETINGCQEGAIGKHIKDRLFNDNKVKNVIYNDIESTTYLDDSWILECLFSSDIKKQELGQKYMELNRLNGEKGVSVVMGDEAWQNVCKEYEDATDKTLNSFSNEKLSKYTWKEKKCEILRLIECGYLKPLGTLKDIPDWISASGLEKLDGNRQLIINRIISIGCAIVSVIGTIVVNVILKYCLK